MQLRKVQNLVRDELKTLRRKITYYFVYKKLISMDECETARVTAE